MSGKITAIGERGIWVELSAEDIEKSEYYLGEVVRILKTDSTPKSRRKKAELKIMEHWLKTALSRIRAGELEMAVLDDYGYVLKEECPDDCIYNKGRHCVLESGNHCIRRAGDYYKAYWCQNNCKKNLIKENNA